MAKYLLLVFVCVSFITFSQEKGKVTEIDIPFLYQEVIGKDVQLIDIRTPKEFKEGCIDDAINIDFWNKKEFNSAFSTLDTNKPVYIYCHSGGRSRKASKQLLAKGFRMIFDFSGGYKAWSVYHRK